MSVILNQSNLKDISNKLPLFMNCKTKAGFLWFSKFCEEIIFDYCSVFPVECGQLELVAEMWDKGLCDKNLCVTIVSNIVKRMLNHFEEKYKSPKIFISHSTKDEPLVEKFVTMLEQIGVKQPQLFCSSVAGYNIPQGAGDIYDYIRNEMNNDNLFFVMMLSQNYYNSPVCLNEMGAAWIKQSNYQSILLPGFQYTDIKGAINPRDICFSLSDVASRNYALTEFKDRIVSHLGLDNISHTLWERHRNKFINEVDRIVSEESNKN